MSEKQIEGHKGANISLFVFAMMVLSACDPVHYESYHFTDVSELEKERIIRIIYETKAEYRCDDDKPPYIRVCGGDVYFDSKTSTVGLSQLPSAYRGGFRPEMKDFSEKLYERLQEEFPERLHIAK